MYKWCSFNKATYPPLIGRHVLQQLLYVDDQSIHLPAWQVWPGVDLQNRLYSGEIHLWRFALKEAQDLQSAAKILAEKELLRANRIRSVTTRRKWITGRVFLRMVLSKYLDLDASQIMLKTTELGKPYLPVSKGLEFNLSHAGGWVLVAVAYGRPVGVDVEKMSYCSDLLQMAEMAFGAEFRHWLMALDESQQKKLFYYCWTRLEAVQKLGGNGLMGKPPTQYRVYSVMVDNEHVGALALGQVANGISKIVRCFHCPRLDLSAKDSAPLHPLETSITR